MPLTGAPDLPAAAARFFNGGLWITLGAALLVSATAFAVMRRYLARIFRESQRPGSSQIAPGDGSRTPAPSIRPIELDIETDVGRASRSPAQSATFQHAEGALRRTACFYALGGSVHAAASVGLLFLFGIYTLPTTASRWTTLGCYAGVFWSWSFFTMIALALLSGPDRRLRWMLFLGYAAALPAMGALLQIAGAAPISLADVGLMPKEEAALLLSFAGAVTGQHVTAATVTFPPFLQPLLFWGLAAAPVAMPFLAFNRFVRGTVGPLFINAAVMIVLSTFVIVDLILYAAPGVWLVAHVKRLFGGATYPVLIVVATMLSAVVAWRGLRWIARRYRDKRLSDQTFLFDALWLLASLWVSIYLMGASHQFRYLLGLVPFALYKLSVGRGLRRIATRAETVPNAHLLFLRVFASPRRSENLFDLLAARWRYAGTIELISATDLARGRFEPDEFLDFLGGRLANGYVGDATDLERRLARLDVRPDPDGRFRVNEFFCRADTWQQTVTRLMPRSDLVAMDLRAFTSERKGCLFELGALIDKVPLHRVVLLIDHTTDEPFLRRTLGDLWRTMDPRSPNARGGITRVRLIDLECGIHAAVRHLMQLGDELVHADKPDALFGHRAKV